MRGPLSIVAGLVVGVVVAGLLMAGFVALAPDESTRASPTPSLALPSPSASASASPVASADASASAAASDAAFHVGQPAPALIVPQVGGGTIDLANLKGKPVWVNFMTTWCPSCQDEFPLMNGSAARYADDASS